MVSLLGRELKLEAFKEPRGFLRFLQLIFTMLAFACCADFSSKLEFKITCRAPDTKNGTNYTEQTISLQYSYPFALDHYPNVTVDMTKCPNLNEDSKYVTFPGDYSSDAKFFVFIGVVSWLFCIFTVLVYGFINDLYLDQKNYPLYDMFAAGIISFMFLAASSAWGHALSGLKSSGNPSDWIFDSDDAKVCKIQNDNYINTVVEKCESTFVGAYGGGNVSVLFGFLNCFLFGVNVYYLYKETRFFNSNQGNLQNSPSGSI
eukprot:TRINITY_DN9242_c0_g1_i7.p1 TRINITY_DN9242_c0_g1~~TRINITY_DN9242_c0_g1_i7.p1  ORF type:complete len:260 (+),score=49.38 TRINITY_DN9242_c0_g1_i7:49-828(+)